MSIKTKTLTVTNGWQVAARDGRSSHPAYKVESIVNSLEFEPGQMLPKSEVEALCSAPNWTVKVVQHKSK